MKGLKLLTIITMFSISFVILSSTGCKKAKENKIIGTWKSIPLDSYMDDETYWEFTAGGQVYRSIGGIPTDTGTYYIEQNLFEGYVTVDNLLSYNGENVNGRYRIEKLNKTIMNLLREVDPFGNNGYKRREFVKQ